MAFNIRNTETKRLAAKSARLMGQTKIDAVAEAIEDQLEQLQKKQTRWSLAAELDDIGRRCAKLRVLDERPAEEILGYDSHGVPR